LKNFGRRHECIPLPQFNSFWSLDFVIDNFSRFRKRLGRRWAWIRSGQLQPVLIEYSHDETGLACQIEPMKL
jgi:hypothetical protein